MALKKYTKEWLEELCKESFSIRDVLSKAGRDRNSGGNYSYLKKKIQQFNIDTSHFTGQSWSKGLTKNDDERIMKRVRTKEKSISELFIENSLTQRNVIRGRIIKDNLINYQCSFCGNSGEWFGKIMPLELDHINGVNNDNRIENLRFLCPNCHSTTETFSGRNNKIG